MPLSIIIFERPFPSNPIQIFSTCWIETWIWISCWSWTWTGISWGVCKKGDTCRSWSTWILQSGKLPCCWGSSPCHQRRSLCCWGSSPGSPCRSIACQSSLGSSHCHPARILLGMALSGSCSCSCSFPFPFHRNSGHRHRVPLLGYICMFVKVFFVSLYTVTYQFFFNVHGRCIK